MKTHIFILFIGFFPIISCSEVLDSELEDKSTTINEPLPKIATADTLSTKVSIDSSQVLVYPDPAKDKFFIKYELTKKARVTIKINDLPGTFTDVVFDGEQGAGMQSIEYKTILLRNGVYVIEMLVDATEINKIVTIQGK